MAPIMNKTTLAVGLLALLICQLVMETMAGDEADEENPLHALVKRGGGYGKYYYGKNYGYRKYDYGKYDYYRKYRPYYRNKPTYYYRKGHSGSYYGQY